jgi:hypothetical protein
MELAWFMTGIAYATLAAPDRRDDFEEMAARTYCLLKKNQGRHGFFGHQNAKGLKGFVRGRIGSFADQVYPIYAMTRFAEAYEFDEALESALACAKAICNAQGELGQWWWHYDSGNGKVVQRYPVYSVHQDGMAPLALFAVGEAAGVDFDRPIYKGLAWISGNNELSTDLCDRSSRAIWRCIYRDSWNAYAQEVWNAIIPEKTAASKQNLCLLFECRPYHLGWLLYAFAGKDGEK